MLRQSRITKAANIGSPRLTLTLTCGLTSRFGTSRRFRGTNGFSGRRIAWPLGRGILGLAMRPTVTVALAALLFFFNTIAVIAGDRDHDGLSDDFEQELLNRFVPTF